jgi:hypothetical protein
MNDPADNLDQTDEEILISTLSDEALEAAAGPGECLYSGWTNMLGNNCCGPI